MISNGLRKGRRTQPIITVNEEDTDYTYNEKRETRSESDVARFTFRVSCLPKTVSGLTFDTDHNHCLGSGRPGRWYRKRRDRDRESKTDHDAEGQPQLRKDPAAPGRTSRTCDDLRLPHHQLRSTRLHTDR